MNAEIVSDSPEKPAPPGPFWKPADDVQPVADLFNQGHIVEGTQALKALQEDAAIKREFGAWRAAIQVLNGEVDLKKLGMQDVGQIIRVDDSGNLITASADRLKEQIRVPTAPEKAKSEFDLFMTDNNSGQLIGLDQKDSPQVLSVEQYIEDLHAPKTYRSREELQIKDDITPIVKAFEDAKNVGNYEAAIDKLKTLQDADKSQEPQVWLRHIEAVNANLDFSKQGLKDVSQIFGVDGKGNLLTVSANGSAVQIRGADDPNGENTGEKNHFGLTFRPPDGKEQKQIQAVADVMKEATETQLSKLGPGWHHLTFTSDGEQREADVYVGKGVNPAIPAPVVYALHGAGPPPERGSMEGDTHASKWADANNGIVVYPFAEEHTQLIGNIGGILGVQALFNPNMEYHAWQTFGISGLNETRQGHDDVDSIKALDKLVSDKLNIDSTRKIIATFSDGSTLVKPLAVAIGASAVIEFHGGVRNDFKLPSDLGVAFYAETSEKDKVLPLAGASTYNGILGNWERRWPKMVYSDPTYDPNEFAKANGCSGKPIVTEDTPEEVRTEFRPDQCTTGMPVVLIDRRNDGHLINNPLPNPLLDPATSILVGLELGFKDPNRDDFSALVNEALKHPRKVDKYKA
jgi:poly(3-hydroxybutyrate) depolymerase